MPTLVSQKTLNKLLSREAFFSAQNSPETTWRPGSARTRWGAYSALSGPIAIKGVGPGEGKRRKKEKGRGRGRKGREEKGRGRKGMEGEWERNGERGRQKGEGRRGEEKGGKVRGGFCLG